jgi:hypothetical protein
MPAGGKRHGAGCPKGSRALTLLAPTEIKNFARETSRLALLGRVYFVRV